MPSPRRPRQKVTTTRITPKTDPPVLNPSISNRKITDLTFGAIPIGFPSSYPKEYGEKHDGLCLVEKGQPREWGSHCWCMCNKCWNKSGATCICRHCPCRLASLYNLWDRVGLPRRRAA